MSVTLSLAAKAAVIAVGGVIVTMIVVVAILIVYCCTCHRRIRGEYKVQTRQAKINAQTHSQELLTMGSSVPQSRTSTGQSSCERLCPPLGTLQNGLHRELEACLQSRESPSGPPSGGPQNDLEISQKTWSAYETLPRNIKQFDKRDEHDFGSDSDYMESPPTLQSTMDDIDTIDNDAYSTSTELAQLSRHAENSSNSDESHRTHLPPPLRISTISTSSSTGSGYVINSLHSPNRTSRYSTASDGYVISHLEWTKPSHAGQTTTALPSITENTNRLSQVEYLTIVPS